MNIHIVKGLLMDCASFVKPLFAAATFSFEECLKLKRMYDTSEPLPATDRQRVEEPINDPPLSFGYKEGFRIRVNNLRHVVVLFDALLENSFIQSRWQSVLDKGRFLQSKDGTRAVSASSPLFHLSVPVNLCLP